ncbi:DUF1275 domain-containing protein [Amycolatopsis acidicola]|uniref:DUF1275 domain-containing protein n=1 Tax=Amycolatopsis acidicola TaxID=2596893 RepID=A0A5N0VJD9_9PSEU|nr:YoaK family protein [Amycolatopsis acidicola]KAA9165593.1 DUF1275 domain-containing protein [Amycolatopsis acidicola]
MEADERPSVARDYFSGPEHGPLPALLLVLTVTTGLIDAVSVLALGRVFVANMTGNVVFTGFALAGAPGFVLDASLVALAGFLVGAFVGGIAIGRWGGHRGALLRNVTSLQFVLLTIALIVMLVGDPLGAAPRDVVLACAGMAFGLQNAGARKLAVPDITTTVLTMTLTGVVADLRARNTRVLLRRALSVVCMLAGAIVGALLVVHNSPTMALGLADLLVAVVAAVAAAVSVRPAPWH